MVAMRPALMHIYQPQPIAHDALTILINLSNDEDVLRNLAGDDTFLESLLLRVTVC